MDKRIKKALEAVQVAFETGEVARCVVDSIIHKDPRDDKPSDHWSPLNRAFMLIQGTYDARGFKQWKRVGRYVTAGSKAIFIWRPKTIRYKDKESGELETACIGFTPQAVFRYEDTDGKELPTFNYEPALKPDLMEVAAAMGTTVKYSGASKDSGAAGFFNPNANHIQLMSQDEKVFWHELAHAVDHHIGSSDTENRTEDATSRREVVAETVAACISYMHGKEEDLPKSALYVKHFKAPVIELIDRIVRVMEFILEGHKEVK